MSGVNLNNRAYRYKKTTDSVWTTVTGTLGYSVTSGTANGTYSGSLSGLTANTEYEVQAYFEGPNGGTWSASGRFTTNSIPATLSTTAATNVAQTTATLNGTLALNGNTFTSGVFRIATNATFTAGVRTVPYSNSTNPTANITGLTVNTTYYCRLEVTHSGSTTVIAPNYITFKPSFPPPTLTTTAATNVQQTTATLNGTMNLNGATFTTGLFRVATNTAFTTGVKTVPFTNSTTPSANMTGLTANTTYYCRIEATSSGGTTIPATYITFKTLPIAPTLAVTAATTVQPYSATLNGTMNLNGGTFTSGEFRIATNTAFTTGVRTVPFTNSATPTANITGLAENTKYYCRIEATSNGGTTISSNMVDFTTPYMYHPDDVAAINWIISNSTLGWTVNAPASWTTSTVASQFIEWDNSLPKRLTNITVPNISLSGSLDLSLCISLVDVNLDDNQLTSLNVNGCTNMVFLSVRNNKISSLDASGLTALLNLACGSDELTKVDLNGCTALTYVGITAPNLNELVKRNGDTMYFQATAGGKVKFGFYDLGQERVGMEAVPDAGKIFIKWTSDPLPFSYYVGTDTSANLEVVLPTGGDNIFTARFNGPPTVNIPDFTNITATGADFSGIYNPMTGTIDTIANAYRYRKVGDATWTPGTGTLGYTVTTGTADGTYSGSLSNLDPNTEYEVEVYFESEHGGTWSTSGTFVTKPDFVAWTAAASTTSATQATVSGTYYVGEPIIGATIRYGTDPTLVVGTDITLATGEYTNAGFSYTLTGLTGGTTYYVRTTVTNATGTTSSVDSINTATSSGIQSFTTGRQLTVEYKEIGTGTTLMPTPIPYIVTGSSIDVALYVQQLHGISGKDYYPMYYKVTGDTAEYAFDTLYTITADTTITIYYVEADTNLDVSIPTQLLWAAFESDGGAVVSPYYRIENNSDRPVDVSFVSVNVINPDGVSFVSSIGGNDEVRLDVAGTAGTQFAGASIAGLDTSGTALGIAGELGRLGGSVTPTIGNWGEFAIGGQYQGGFYTPTTYKQPILDALLKLDLDLS